MDMILFNGRIATMDAGNPEASAVLIRDGRFEYVGDDLEVMALADSDTRILDLMGRFVCPGFNDSHLHLLNYAYGLTKVDCGGAASVDEIIERARHFLEAHPVKPGQWILGRGWNQTFFNNQQELTRHDLDRISTDHPISFTRVCEHVTVANSKAIEMLGITKETPQPEGGRFDVDHEGNPTGVFRETARYMIYEAIEEADLESIKKMLIKASEIMSSYGITSVQTDDFETFAGKDYELILRAYHELIDEGKLGVRIYEQCLLSSPDRLQRFLDAGYLTGQGNEFFRIGPLKLLADGSLGARTAYLTEPYADAPETSGLPVFSQSELDNLVISAHVSGMQVALHAIGDKTIYMCFESFEKAQQKFFREDPRFSIIHVQITDEPLLKKFAEQQVIANVQPIALDNDLHIVENRVGKDRAAFTYHYRTLIDLGAPVALSSDCPVDSVDPLKNIYAAVTRQDLNGEPPGGWMPEEKLTIHQALYALTMGAAYASYEENLKGSIEPGKLADLTVLSENPFAVPETGLLKIRVDMTMMNGNIVYTREGQ